jgi:methionyl-tRNA synthetase
MKKFYITTPIYYVNSEPHLGHIYTTIIADTLAAFKRQRGYDVFFLTGTDEHGQNIERAAAKAARPVQTHVDAIVARFQTVFRQFQFRYDHWIRTTDEYHRLSAQELFRRVRDAGYIYKGHYEGWYCVGCGEFKEEITPGQAPYCELHGRESERVAEESYFFKLSAMQERLLALYEEQPQFIQPEARRNEVISFVRSGLKDLSVSRVSVKWGIPVPDDPDHTMYVWFDALSNYITALGWGDNGRQGFENYWPADIQLVGKDIVRFHTVYWPAFLLAAGIAPPQRVYAHGMWMSGGRKMSKTLGNVIELDVLLRYFSRDQIRYFCLREMVFGQDGDFTYEALIDRVNADLAKGLGNLTSRLLKMVEKYCDNVLPDLPMVFQTADAENAVTGEDWSLRALQVKKATLAGQQRWETEFEQCNFSRALEAIWEIIASVDKYLSDSKPWNVAKDPHAQPQLNTILYTSLEALRFITVLLAPIMPEATNTIGQYLALPVVSEINPQCLTWGGLASGAKIPAVSPLFPILDKEQIMSEINQNKPDAVAATTEPVVTASETTVEVAPLKSLINIDDFVKVDLRVGQVLAAERVPKSDKLLRMDVDLGEAQPRQILAGIAAHYGPEQMVGRKIIVVANLQPRKLRGYESQGMLLAASIGEEGRPIVAGFLEDVPNGAKLK